MIDKNLNYKTNLTISSLPTYMTISQTSLILNKSSCERDNTLIRQHLRPQPKCTIYPIFNNLMSPSTPTNSYVPLRYGSLTFLNGAKRGPPTSSAKSKEKAAEPTLTVIRAH